MSLKRDGFLALSSFIALLIGTAVSLEGFTAVDRSMDEVFKHTTRVSKSHMAKVYFPKNVLVELRTNTPAGQATDPVLFLLSANVNSSGQPLVRKASDDMNSGTTNAKLTHTSTTGEWMTVIVVAYDSDYVGSTNLLIKIGSAAAETVPIWAGGTVYKTGWATGDTFTLTGHYNEYTLEHMCLDKIGSRPGNISTTWDDYTMTCNSRFNDAGVVKNEAYTRNQICVQAAPYHINSDGESIPTKYNWINPANPTCQYVSNATDSFALAVANWAKIDQICNTVYNNQGIPITICFDTAIPPSVQAMDDDSGSGRHFRLTMPDTAAGASGMVIAALSPWVTQYKAYYDDPTNPKDDEKDYAAYVDDECSRKWRDYYSQWRPTGTAGVIPSECPGGAQAYLLADNAYRPYARLYHDKTVVNGANDADEDGLSAQLETVLGTSSTDRDHDNDGIIDGLEVYGPLVSARSTGGVLLPNTLDYGKSVGRYFPLPLYGADPLVKDIFFEMDTQAYVLAPPAVENAANERMRSLEAAGETFALSKVHLVFVMGGPNRNDTISDVATINQYNWDATAEQWVRNSTPASTLLVAQQNTNPATWAIDAAQLFMDIAPTYFDLMEYPFVRYGAFVATVSADRRVCGYALTTVIRSNVQGAGTHRHSLPYGRYVVLTGIKHDFPLVAGGVGRACNQLYTANERTTGGSATHEFGHLMAIGHSGPGWGYDYQYSPNHWSRMTYGFALPITEVQVKNGVNWVTRNIPNIDWDNDGTPGGDFPMRTQQCVREWFPPHFSKGPAMVDIDENSLNEQAGLLGDGSRFVFERIGDYWTNPGVFSRWVPEVGVTWVDWDRNQQPAAVGVIRANPGLYRSYSNLGVNADVDNDGNPDNVDVRGNCFERNGDNHWINITTRIDYGLGAANQLKACRDVIPGTYQVAKMNDMDIDVFETLVENHDATLQYNTFQNETEYLKKLDLSGWTQYWEGIWQYRVVSGNPLIPRTTPTDRSVANLPSEQIE